MIIKVEATVEYMNNAHKLVAERALVILDNDVDSTGALHLVRIEDLPTTPQKENT